MIYIWILCRFDFFSTFEFRHRFELCSTFEFWSTMEFRSKSHFVQSQNIDLILKRQLHRSKLIVVFKLVFIMVRNNVRNIWKTTHLERRIIRLPSQIIKPELFSKTPLREAGVQMSEEFIISICGRLAKWDDYRKRFSSTCQYWEKFWSIITNAKFEDFLTGKIRCESWRTNSSLFWLSWKSTFTSP